MAEGYILTHDNVITKLDLDDPEQCQIWNDWRSNEDNRKICKDTVGNYTVYTYFLDMGTAEGGSFFASAVWKATNRQRIIAMKYYGECVEEACQGHDQLVTELGMVSKKANEILADNLSFPPKIERLQDEMGRADQFDRFAKNWASMGALEALSKSYGPPEAPSESERPSTRESDERIIRLSLAVALILAVYILLIHTLTQ